MTESDCAHSKTHFGFKNVPLDDKQDLVDEVFHAVAHRYDLMNDFMSGGLHRAWKADMVNMLAPPRAGRRSFRVLDMAGGTGDVAFRILRQGGPSVSVTVSDINADMLKVGRERAITRSLGNRCRFIQANAEDLPFDNNHFDGYTIAFGIRNVPRINVALKEAHRALKFGGRFLCLEFSQVDAPLLEQVYEFYSFSAIPRIGKWVAGDAEPYQYLVESIRKFPNPTRFADMMTEAGFRRVSYRQLTGGIVAIHSGWKL